jgi:tyrosyl-tRNA synthetase
LIALIAEHQTAPHLRVLQKRLAEEVTIFVHGKEELEKQFLLQVLSLVQRWMI